MRAFSLLLPRATVVAAMLTLLAAAPVALAGAPDTVPDPNVPADFAPGVVCPDGIHFENTTLRARDSYFDPAPGGSSRFVARGMAVSLVTDTSNGNTYPMRGGLRFTITTAPDGSLRVDASGTDIIAWYFPGDDAELGPGLYDIDGRVTEWYSPDGVFLRATFDGRAINLCEALAD